MNDEHAQLAIESRSELRAWLAEHHADTSGVWVVTWKVRSGHPHVSYDDVVEEALCFGWVDSRERRLDDLRSQLLLTPRRRRSNWSASNVRRIDKLAAAGLLQPAGVAAVAAAQAAGRWPMVPSGDGAAGG